MHKTSLTCLAAILCTALPCSGDFVAVTTFSNIVFGNAVDTIVGPTAVITYTATYPDAGTYGAFSGAGLPGLAPTSISLEVTGAASAPNNGVYDASDLVAGDAGNPAYMFGGGVGTREDCAVCSAGTTNPTVLSFALPSGTLSLLAGPDPDVAPPLVGDPVSVADFPNSPPLPRFGASLIEVSGILGSSSTQSFSFSHSVVPEPSAFFMVGGVFATGIFVRRRSNGRNAVRAFVARFFGA